jgi:hypothetical protein
MTTLSTVIAEGLYSALPAFGINGRIYFATDTKRVYRDNGTAWVEVTPGAVLAATLSAIPGAPGNFSIAHGLAAAPSVISILMTSPGPIWAQTPAFDGINVYLVASDAAATATIFVFA